MACELRIHLYKSVRGKADQRSSVPERAGPVALSFMFLAWQEAQLAVKSSLPASFVGAARRPDVAQIANIATQQVRFNNISRVELVDERVSVRGAVSKVRNCFRGKSSEASIFANTLARPEFLFRGVPNEVKCLLKTDAAKVGNAHSLQSRLSKICLPQRGVRRRKHAKSERAGWWNPARSWQGNLGKGNRMPLSYPVLD